MLLLYFFVVSQPFDPHYTPVDIKSPSFIPTNRTSLLSVDNTFQTLCLDPAKGNFYIDNVSTQISLLDISGNHSDSCLKLNGVDKELSEDVEIASINIGNDTVGSTSCEISKPYVPLNGRAFSNTMSISLLKSDNSSYLPSSTSYVQHQPTENKLELQSLQIIEDVDLDDQEDVLSPRTDIMDIPSELDCSHPVPLNHGFEVQSCESTGTQNFTLELDNSCSPVDDLLLVPDLPHPIGGQTAQWKGEAVQLDGQYVSSESGYVQSQYSTNNTECYEGDEQFDTDLFTDQELTDEDGEQCPQLLAVRQSLGSPTCLFDIEDTAPNVNFKNHDAEQASDTDAEVGMLALYEPNIYCVHYGPEESPIPETHSIPYTPQRDSCSVGYLPGDMSIPSNSLALNYTPSNISSEYVMSGGSFDSNQKLPMDVSLLRRLNDAEEDIDGFNLMNSDS